MYADTEKEKVRLETERMEEPANKDGERPGAIQPNHVGRRYMYIESERRAVRRSQMGFKGGKSVVIEITHIMHGLFR